MNLPVFLLFSLILLTFFDVRITPFNPFELLGSISLVLLCGAYALRAARGEPIKLSVPSGFLIAYVVWAFGVGFAAWEGLDGSLWVDMKRLLPALGAFWAIVALVQTRARFRWSLLAWVIAGLFNALLGIWQFLQGGPYPVMPSEIAMSKLDLTGEVTERLVLGFYSHPNPFAETIMPYAIVFTVALLSPSAPWPRRLQYACCLAPFALALLLATAKGAMVWALIGSLVGISLARYQVLRRLWVVGLVWLAGVLGTYALGVMLATTDTLASLTTLLSRVEMVLASLYLFLDHPLNFVFGAGIQRWDYYSSVWSSWPFPNAHNVLINQLLYYGLIGTITLFAFILLSLKFTIRHGVAINGLYSPFPYVGAIVALMGNYMFEPSFAYPSQKFQLFFLIAMAILASGPSSPLFKPDEAEERAQETTNHSLFPMLEKGGEA